MRSDSFIPRISDSRVAIPLTPAERDVTRRADRALGDAGLDRRLLSVAVSIAAAQLKQSHPDAECGGALAQLVDTITQALGGRRSTQLQLQCTVPPGVVILALRDAVLEVTGPDVTGTAAQSMVRLLRAIKSVQESVVLDPRENLTEHLCGSRGLEMVVEVAHDMRSPLTSILFLVETLRSGRSGAITPVQERQLGLVYGAAFGLSSMASDVIELARGGSRLLETNPVPFSLVETIESVRDIVRPIAEEKQLQLTTACTERHARIGYQAALSRILLNLTTNALKFTNEGSVEVSAMQMSQTRVAFEVRDTGPGVPPHVHSTLFSPFRKPAYGRGSVFSSAGLGLSICRKLVAAMGSELMVESIEGKGTRFRFELELPIASKM